MPISTIIDPLVGPKLAISGRVATMDKRNRVLASAVIYIEHGQIFAVRAQGENPPQGFENVPIRDTGGTIFPGMIELHNHLPYDILPLWKVPKLYKHRAQWAGTNEYQRLITSPMTILGRSEFVPSVVRYVECKTLLSGVTTTQGVELFSNAGIRRYYKGCVRNVEQTDDEHLPEAKTRIADIEATDASKFLKRLEAGKLILHLAEGVGPRAREHFRALHIDGKRWAINKNLIGIHCTGLWREDFEVMGRLGGSTVWSPLSNLLLYGETTDVKAARDSGVAVSLGSDWSPTGSKNLLGELKVARLYSRAHGDLYSDVELVEMVTKNPASMLGWNQALGSIEPGKRADLIAVESSNSDPYVCLVRAEEADVRLVMVNGVARAGLPPLMEALTGRKGEVVDVGGQKRSLFLKQQTADPVSGKLSLAKARDTLEKALDDLPRAARRLTPPGQEDPDAWNIALDELSNEGMEVRHRLAAPDGHRTGPELPDHLPRLLTSPAAAEELVIELDPLAVADDVDYLNLIEEEQANLPAFVGRLRSLYGH